MAGQPLDPAGSPSSRPRLMKTHMSDAAACFKLHRTATLRAVQHCPALAMLPADMR